MKNTKSFAVEFKVRHTPLYHKNGLLLFGIIYVADGQLKSSTVTYNDISVAQSAKIEVAIASLEKRMKRGVFKEVKVSRISKD